MPHGKTSQSNYPPLKGSFRTMKGWHVLPQVVLHVTSFLTTKLPESWLLGHASACQLPAPPLIGKSLLMMHLHITYSLKCRIPKTGRVNHKQHTGANSSAPATRPCTTSGYQQASGRSWCARTIYCTLCYWPNPCSSVILNIPCTINLTYAHLCTIKTL